MRITYKISCIRRNVRWVRVRVRVRVRIEVGVGVGVEVGISTEPMYVEV